MPPIPATLKMSRVFNAPRPLVWKVWTDPAHLSQWWGPFGPAQTRCDIDFRVGGKFLVTMTAPDGATFPASGKFIDIVAPERIVYEGAPEAPTACGCGLPPLARVTVLFDALQDAKTKLSIETIFPDETARDAANAAGFSASWEKSLSILEEMFATGAFGAAVE
ncbi:MAG: SRPBCC domain-containing protein [Parvularculaceae bacterium]